SHPRWATLGLCASTLFTPGCATVFGIESDGLHGEITELRQWDSSIQRRLSGVLTIKDGGELIIDKGTKIFADPGSAIIVEPGGKLRAWGREDAPIVFTKSVEAGDEHWGGIALLGFARTSRTATDLPSELPPGTQLYGGTDDSDSSGKLCF